MSEPEKRDHWGELVESMGVAPPPEKAQPEQPAPLSTHGETGPGAEPQQPVVAPQRRTEPRPRPQADWSQLAADLGIAPPPAPAPPAVEPVQPQRTQFKRAQREPAPFGFQPAAAQAEIDSEAVEEARMRAEVWESQLVDVSDPVFVDSADGLDGAEGLDSAEATETAPREPTEEAQRGPRRRRRKKRHKRRPIEGSEGRTESTPAEEYLEEVLGESVDEAPAEAGETTEPESPAEAERREGRKRRRRRRKKRPEGAMAGEQPEAVEAQGESSAEPDDEHDEHDDEHDEAEEAHDAEHEEGDESSGKLSHRAIPTWEQAIGLIISRNLEARAKNPNGGQHRGGRGRQRGR